MGLSASLISSGAMCGSACVVWDCGVVGGAGGYIGVFGQESGSFAVDSSDDRDDGEEDKLGKVESVANEDGVKLGWSMKGCAGASFGVNRPFASLDTLRLRGASLIHGPLMYNSLSSATGIVTSLTRCRRKNTQNVQQQAQDSEHGNAEHGDCS